MGIYSCWKLLAGAWEGWRKLTHCPCPQQPCSLSPPPPDLTRASRHTCERASGIPAMSHCVIQPNACSVQGTHSREHHHDPANQSPSPADLHLNIFLFSLPVP